MNRLLNAYKSANSLTNARRLRTYILKHPFSLCLLTADDAHLVNEAVRLADREA